MRIHALLCRLRCAMRELTSMPARMRRRAVLRRRRRLKEKKVVCLARTFFFCILFFLICYLPFIQIYRKNCKRATSFPHLFTASSPFHSRVVAVDLHARLLLRLSRERARRTCTTPWVTGPLGGSAKGERALVVRVVAC